MATEVVSHIKTNCSNCGNPLESERVGRHRYCLRCHADYAKSHRLKYSELSQEQKQKVIARKVVRRAVRNGTVAKCPCQICGEEIVEAHHEDYTKRYDVIWLCRKHHLWWHRVLKNGGNPKAALDNQNTGISQRLKKGNRKDSCSKCGQPNDRLPQRYCKSCHKASMQSHRKKPNPEQTI